MVDGKLELDDIENLVFINIRRKVESSNLTAYLKYLRNNLEDKNEANQINEVITQYNQFNNQLNNWIEQFAQSKGYNK